MSEKNIDITNFINQFPKDEMLQKLNSIEDKIGSLHTISSKDFLLFNSLLKKYYPKIKETSEANKGINSFFSENMPKITGDIKEKRNTLKKYVEDSRFKSSKIIEYLSLIYSSFSLTVVPFNNYKQNLITFKYILANLKLHLGYINFENGEKLKESVEKQEKIIDTIHKQIEEANNTTNLVSREILDLKEYTTLTYEDYNEKVFDKLKEITSKIRKLSEEKYLPENTISDLTLRTQNCFAHMGDVITNIQYHDIIRQKMEHIQTSQRTLISGLKDLEPRSEGLKQQIEFIVKIPEITELQVAQLLYTNKDYQTSIEKITNKLISVGYEMNKISGNYNTIVSVINKFENNFIAELTENQEAFNLIAQKINTNCSDVIGKSKILYEKYEQLKSKYNNIFNTEKELRKEIKNFEDLTEAKEKLFARDLVKKLVLLLSDLQSNSNSLKTNLNNITTNYLDLNNLAPETEIKDNLLKTSINVTNSLDNELKNIKEICTKFGKLSINMSEEITSSIKKIEYYTFFKNAVDEIVTLLNSINDKINYDNLKISAGKNNEILEEIEQLYTMKSERDIHQIMTKSGKKIDEIIESEENNDIDDMDIELF